MNSELPPLPVDDVSLDMYWTAIYPPPDTEAERSSLGDVLDMLSEMGGSDLNAEIESESFDGIRVMRDVQYHLNDLVAALITEIRRLRSQGL